MSEKRMVLVVTIIGKTDDMKTAEALARDLRTAYTRYKATIDHASVYGFEVPPEKADKLRQDDFARAGHAAASGVVVHSQDPEIDTLFEAIRRSRMQ